MNPYRLAAACAALLLASSCINTEKEIGTSRPGEFTPTPEGARARVTDRTVLRTVTATRYFSTPRKKDNFILQLRGPKILSAQARFLIVSSAGDTLRNETMPARVLLNDITRNDLRATTLRAKEIAILQGMNSFFREDRFTRPAVPRTADQPADVDAQAWQAIKEDPKAVGFDYVTATGKERRLAYARKLQKAVVVAE